MATALSALSLLVVHAATLTPATVPATGAQEALLTLDAPSAIHLSARSGSGTHCEVIDRVRGPFASSGTAGTSNCELDLLLDAGQYKVRLESALRGKGSVALAAAPFTELNATPVRLVPGSGLVTKLKAGQQASFWLSVDRRHVPNLRIAGRQAGDVRVWRNGEWIEPLALHHVEFSPTPGQPLHEWWLDSVLEEGEYLVTAYGRDATTVTGASVDDSLTVEYGFRQGPVERAMPFTLGPSGMQAVQVDTSGVVAMLSLASSPPAPVELQLLSGSVRSPSASCRIDKAALAPECLTSMRSYQAAQVLVVRGPPGTRGLLEWGDLSTDSDSMRIVRGGYYGPSTTQLSFTIGRDSAASRLLAVHDLPNDTDGVPLGCQLERLGRNGEVAEVVAHSAVTLKDGEKFEREFNYDSSATFWFEIASGGNVLQKIGIASRKFNVTTSGGLKSNCEVYRLDSKGALTRLTRTKTEGTECSEQLDLDPGLYQLSLSGGLSGVEKVSIAPSGDASAKNTPMQGGCLIPKVSFAADDYRLVLNRAGNVRVRGLSLPALPLQVSGPVHLQLDAGQRLELPVLGGAVVRSSGGVPFGCSLASARVTAVAGECTLPPLKSSEVLTLVNTGAAPISLTFAKPGALPALAAPSSYAPTIRPLPTITPDVATFFDFERGQSHAVAFTVDKAGLYNVTTQGLLNTECRLRTPVVPDVTSDRGGGRGRNCLVQTYLQPGRYLMTAQTVGSSRGRGAMFLSRRPVRDYAGLVGEDEQFFRVGDGELVQQRLKVTAAGDWTLSTTAQGISSMQCRLDDPAGWPVETVPSACTGTRSMRAGTYLWTQLPLTVESMRHTKLSRVRDEVVLQGNKAHPVQYFTWYRAKLGPDGKDEFLFTLEGETALDVVLTGGMQGRVYRLEKDKAAKAVEVIPPMQPSGEGDSYEAESGEGEYDEDSEGEGDREYEGEGDGEGEYDEPRTAPVEVARAQAAPPPPSGVRVTLPPGRYRLVTEHSRGDVGIEYQLHLGSATLLPGMARSLPVPSTVPVLVPRDGTLRLSTEGEADVRCRLIDDKGRLVFEGSDNGPDWNCAVAEPVKAGRYTLVVESETQGSGETKLTLALPPSDAKGPIADGQKYALKDAVVTLDVPVAERDSVQEVALTSLSKTPVSCALEYGSGAVVHRLSRVSTCAMLIRPKLDKYKVRVWTTDGRTTVQATFRSKPIVEGGKGSVPGENAIAVVVPSAGLYRTSPQVQCLGGAEAGLLRACGPQSSLEAGATLFAVAGIRAQPLPLDEVRATANDAPAALALSRRAFIQAVGSAKPSVLLLEARVQHGERAAPSCAFDGPGTVRERRADACFAVAKVGTSAIARLWAPTDERIDAQVTRRAVPLPDVAGALTPGHKTLSFSGVGRFTLPSQARARVEATLPKGAWGVLLDDAGAALDVCAPTDDLARCSFTGQGGSAVFVSPEGRAETSTVLLEGAPRDVAFTGFFEDSPRSPGSLRFKVPAAKSDRVTGVEGALDCTLVLGDGSRFTSCRARIPAGEAAELQVEHGAGPLRVMVHTPGREKWARLGLELPVVPGPALSPSVAVPLSGGRLDRTLVLGAESVVRVSADHGVCGLFRGNDLLQVDGLDTGCELARVLAPGTYRVLVRPFAGAAQAGTLTWTAEPVTQLAEGFGKEEWLGAGEVRLFRFDTTNKGKVGLGLAAKSELLECAVFNDGYQPLGDGCQQYLSLDKGRFLLMVRNPPRAGATPIAFKPVLLGLSGERNDVPPEVIEDFKRRTGVTP